MTGLNQPAMPDPTPEASFDPWNFRPDVAVELGGVHLAGHKIEAIDGAVGKVVEANLAPGDSYLAVAIGRVFGRTVLLPAGTVNHIDPTERKIYVDRSRDQIKQAPEVARDAFDNPTERDKVAGHYGATYHARGAH